jgi:hypothetical protein
MTVELPAVSPVDGDGLVDGHSDGLLREPVVELPIDLSTEEA